MKKLMIALLVLLLAGCSSNAAKGAQVSDPTQVIFEGNGKKYTKEDLYYTLLGYDYPSALLYDMVYKCAVSEETDFSAYDEEIDSTIEFYKMYYGMTDFAEYGGEETFRRLLAASHFLEDKKKEFAEADLPTYLENDVPVLAKLAYFDDAEAAQKAHDMIEGGNTFEMAVLENGYDTQVTETIYLDSNETLPLQVKEFFHSADAGLSPVITSITQTTDSSGNTIDTARYYLIDLISKDVNDFKDGYLAIKTELIEDNDAIKKIFAEHEIVFYDQETMDKMKSTYEGMFD